MSALATFLRQRGTDVLAAWANRASSAFPRAASISVLNLIDHMPAILDVLADAVDHAGPDRDRLARLSEVHAARRFREGYDVREIVLEYQVLRSVILEMFRAQLPPTADIERITRDSRALQLLHEAIDRSIADAVDQYVTEKERAREMSIAILGHDLRSPLQAVHISAEYLKDSTDPAVQRATKRLLSSAARMARMLDDLIDLARGRFIGAMPTNPRQIDLGEVVASVVEEVTAANTSRSVSHELHGNLVGEWDQERMAQMVANLVTNALQHGSDGVSIRVRDEGERVAVEVRNPGTIPDDLRSRMFEPFASGPTSGMGLGLYIVSEIVKAHGGHISSECSGSETTFRVTLPREPPPSGA